MQTILPPLTQIYPDHNPVQIYQEKNQSPQTRGVWRYGVRAKGVKNRCRKVEWHSEGSSKGLGESLTLDPVEAERLARLWISRNMKTVQQAQACAYFFEQDGDFETWQMMNPEHNVKIPLVF